MLFSIRSFVAAMLGVSCLVSIVTSQEITPEQTEFFEKQVRPVLAKRCYECHSENAKKLQGGLRVDHRSELLQGGDSGPAIVPGKPQESLLISSINYGDLYQMPPKSKLPSEEIAVLTKWVEQGAYWPGDQKEAAAKKKFDIAERKAARWCWQPLTSPAVPKVNDQAWPRDDLDRFLLAKIEAEKFPSPGDTSRAALARRIYFDTIGLPPTSEQLAEFLADASPEATARTVDRLLASPQFGERWGRHWLDLMRYAESRGHEFDPNAPNAFQYRDYVIRALNADVPYADFVREHIAGDLLSKPRKHPEAGYNESILGTGFWMLGEWVHSPVDTRKDETDRFDNMIDVFSKSFLGLTVSCARCHDHKFDPIAQNDYHALLGYLQSSSYRLVRFETMLEEERIAGELKKLREEYATRLLRAAGERLIGTPEEFKSYAAAAIEAVKIGPKYETVNEEAKKKRKPQRRELPGPFTNEYREAITKLAGEKKLDPERLVLWTEALLHSALNDRDPLHGLALVAQGKPANLVREWARKLTSLPEAPGLQPVAGWDQIEKAAWRENGVSFGSRAVAQGEPLWGDDPLRPIAGIAESTLVRRDPFWKVLQAGPLAENDPGKIGEHDRAGKTWKTDTFALEGSVLHFLVRGSGTAYAVMDSHAVVQGPLHGATVVHSPGKADQWRWVRQDLRPYKGHRIHLEFSAIGKEPFEIAEIMQGSDANPPPFVPGTIDALAGLYAGGDDETKLTLDFVIRDYAGEIEAGLGNLLAAEAGKLRVVSPWADWLLTNTELFTSGEPLPVEREFAEKQAKLASQVRPASNYALAMWDGSGENDRFLIRGNASTPAAEVPRRGPEAIFGTEPLAPTDRSGRLELAERIVSRENPFFARVLVNRVWHHLFGRGLVPSVDNFGMLGAEPTHPELLDHLSQRFLAEGGSVKKLIRNIMLSRAYGMTSHPAEEAIEVRDPKNLLWRHALVRRLQGEAIRDSMLAVSGRLDLRAGGKSVPVFLTAYMQGRGRPGSGPLDGEGRRSVYLSVRRNFLSPMLLAFDTPIPFSSVGQRNVSNVPAQALILMNDPFAVQQAELWAKRVLSGPERPTGDRIRDMYRTAFARDPSEMEAMEAEQFLTGQAKHYAVAQPDVRCWTDFAHVLFNVKEFIFLE